MGAAVIPTALFLVSSPPPPSLISIHLIPIPTGSGSLLLLFLAAQLCLTLCNPRDCSPPGSSVHRISQARILKWVFIPFSRRSSWPRIEPVFPAWQVQSLPLSHLGSSHSHWYACLASSLISPWVSGGRNHIEQISDIPSSSSKLQSTKPPIKCLLIEQILLFHSFQHLSLSSW